MIDSRNLYSFVEETPTKPRGLGETTNPTTVCVFNRDSVHLVDKEMSS